MVVGRIQVFSWYILLLPRGHLTGRKIPKENTEDVNYQTLKLPKNIDGFLNPSPPGQKEWSISIIYLK